jgi:hypothetical protein
VLTDLEAWVFCDEDPSTPLDPRLWRKLQSAVVASTSLRYFTFGACFDGCSTPNPTASQAFDGLVAAVDPGGRLYRRDPKQTVTAACEFMGVPTPHRCDAEVHVKVYLQMCKQSADANASMVAACRAKGIEWLDS